MGAKRDPGTLTIFASAARTASATGDVLKIKGGQYRGLAIQIAATAAAATPSVVFTVQGSTNGGQSWTTHLESAAVTGVATVNLVCHPDAADIANLSETTAFPNVWRVIATAADGDSLTYSVKAWPLR